MPRPVLVRPNAPVIGVLMVRASLTRSVRMTSSAPAASAVPPLMVAPPATLPERRMPLTVTVWPAASVKLLLAFTPSVPARFKVVKVAVFCAVTAPVVCWCVEAARVPAPALVTKVGSVA